MDAISYARVSTNRLKRLTSRIRRPSTTIFSPKQRFAIRAALFGSIGGFLFGYDSGVISGALPALSQEFQLDTSEQEIVVSLLILGGFIGAILGGYICDKIGRSKTLLVVNSIFLIGSIILGGATDISMVCIGRVVIGMAVSMSGIVDVAYLTEISPIEYRGAVVSCNELMITIGLMTSFCMNYLFMDLLHGWRYMFLLPVPVTLCWSVWVMFMPESPRWLLVQGKIDEALRVYQQVLGNEEDAERESRQAAIEIDKCSQTGTSALWMHWRLATGVAVLLSVLAQLSGNIGVISYTPEIFEKVGMGAHTASLSTVLLGAMKVVVTAAVLPVVDRVGRRPLLLSGVGGITLSLLALSISCYLHSVYTKPIALTALCCFVTAFSISYGPITWLISAELLPDELRGRALGLVAISTWGSSLLVSSTFLSIVDGVGIDGTFLIFSVLSSISFLAIYIILPETMQRQPLAILRDLHLRLRVPLSDDIASGSCSQKSKSKSVDEGELSRQILMMTLSPLPPPSLEQEYDIVPEVPDDCGDQDDDHNTSGDQSETIVGSLDTAGMYTDTTSEVVCEEADIESPHDAKA